MTLRFVKVDLRLNEVPGRTCLAFWISGCKEGCKGCHTPWLAEDLGYSLVPNAVQLEIEKYKGLFDTILFMGGDSAPEVLYGISTIFRKAFGYKTAWYSGKDFNKNAVQFFDYYKSGRYIEELGPLSNKLTNQILMDCNTGEILNYKMRR